MWGSFSALIMFFHLFIVIMQSIYNLIGWKSAHIFDIFNHYRANINGMWSAEELGRIYKTFEFTLTWNIYFYGRYRINQHWIVLKLDSVSINKSIAPEFFIAKVSQDLKLM